GYLVRTRTSVANASVSSKVSSFLGLLDAHVAGDLDVMTSAGGLASRVHPKDTLLSGPAGGVIGARRAGHLLGHERIISFDMGGTSTDVARSDGRTPLRFTLRVGDVEILSPTVAIETVASGGGSICMIDRGLARVGPESAGADPGPASYGRGGPFTITDANLLLGRLQADHFRIPVDPALAHDALSSLEAHHDGLEGPALAEAFIALADERMADAIRRVSIREGYDPSDSAMVAFGGAGGLHACGVARRLGIRTVVFPRDAGLLSALGIGQAPLESIIERAPGEAGLDSLVPEMEREAIASLDSRGSVFIADRIASVRLAGQSHALDVPFGVASEIEARFRDAYRARFGYDPAHGSIVVEMIRVVAHVAAAPFETTTPPPEERAARAIRVFEEGRWTETSAVDRSSLAEGARLSGPLVVLESHGALYLPTGWDAMVRRGGAIEATTTRAPTTTEPRSIRAELFANRLMTIATEMGEMLEHVAMSANVRERRDFSCAILDASGRLIANAPHVPVHLGSMGVCVRAVLDHVTIDPGDVVVTNHPAYGGSHLPDVTVITPVDVVGRRLGYVASRAHHAEIGGVRPGSMPPMAGRLSDEGVVIPPTKLCVRGIEDHASIRSLLLGAPWPTRAIDENMADLQAQVAANALGAEALATFASDRVDAIEDAMRMLYQRAASRAAETLHALGPFDREAVEHLDDGSPLRVRVRIAEGRASFDFRGSAGVHPQGLNATPAIVRSAVAYIMRVLVREDLPLNEGLLDPVEILLEEGMLSPSFDGDAPGVAGGNVETSQRLVDAMIRVLDLGAGSQGTMNNVVFGNGRFGFYETICGGAGATARAPGADAVHTHMTNTRITDAEVLESRYPVRLESFEVRAGSGGTGTHRGGHGVRRCLRLLEDVDLCVLTQHRVTGPTGRGDGGPGQVGRQWIERANGTREEVPPVGETTLRAGDLFVIETPGGGGWSA
ncbi:MAG: hydantoinase B/oxoprolinase family protein, partial [Phycisphaerales bacterium]|nr:hydantoinase B/oxoprolinase family protein [Phycisphaerales bacterium]